MTPIDRSKTALLVMDFQTPIVAMAGDPGLAALARAKEVVVAARAAGVVVIYVVLGFRPGYPETSAANPRFAAVASMGFFTGRPGDDVHPDIAPAEGDLIVVKHRVGSFTGTDLDLILRTKSTTALILCGLATSGIVLSTARQAFDLDYALTVVSDACADRDAEVHRVLTEKVLAAQATVVTAAAIVDALK